MISSSIQIFKIGETTIQLSIPDNEAVKEYYEKHKTTIPFPYWAKIWPAAMGLSDFLLKNTHFIKNKVVLELAAGLGLPSLLAANYAKDVYCTDYIPESVEFIQRSIEHNGIQNMQAGVVDWGYLPENLSADVLLLSDINYEPEAFEVLYTVVREFLEKGTLIILSTPQRLMAKDFIDRLLPFCIEQSEVVFNDTVISILVLLSDKG